MKVLDLFSGIGGFSLGLERSGMKTIAFCEQDPFCIKILNKHWPGIPVHTDVVKLDGSQYKSIDIVTGGFPCQDVSRSGKQAGLQGERTSLYRHMLRIISQCLPKYAIFENVSGLLTGDGGRWFAKILFDLAQIGYDAEWHCISAAYIGAIHHRDRVWIIAYPESINDGASHTGEVERQESKLRAGVSGANIPSHFKGERRQRVAKVSHYIKSQIELGRDCEIRRGRFDVTEPALCRANDGVSRRVDRSRLRALGNSVVPEIPESIGRAIIQFEAANFN